MKDEGWRMEDEEESFFTTKFILNKLYFHSTSKSFGVELRYLKNVRVNLMM
jgi:hypothetical protein